MVLERLKYDFSGLLYSWHCIKIVITFSFGGLFPSFIYSNNVSLKGLWLIINSAMHMFRFLKGK